MTWLERKIIGCIDIENMIGENPEFREAIVLARQTSIIYLREKFARAGYRAARSLGIGRSTPYRKVSEFGLNDYISRANQTMRPMINVSSMDRS